MTNKLKYFVGNWKMFGDFSSFKIVNKINVYNSKSLNANKQKTILCVPNTLIHFYNSKLKKKFIYLGAQNCHFGEKYGPFTGSVSPAMLKKIGAKFVILGHSENRIEGEKNNLIKKKINSAINQNLNVIFCIGETYKEKLKGKTFSVIKSQIIGSLKRGYNINKLFIAYEPVWSIGTKKTPKNGELKKIVKFIKKFSSKFFRHNRYPKVLYGGSVSPKNIGLLSNIKELDGFLIGGASQSSKKFIDIIKNYYK